MSTAAPQTAPARLPEARREIVIVSHSSLFYWWPVWAVGYLLAAITAFTGEHVALTPGDSVIYKSATGTIEGDLGTEKGIKKVTESIDRQDLLAAPKAAGKHDAPGITLTRVLVSTNKNLGVIFTLVLLVVIFITNVPLRGLWSVIVIIFIVALVIILGLLGVTETILHVVSGLDIRFSLGGYVVISTALLILWLIVFFLFDRQIYMIFTPGQLRVKLEIGDAETAYDTTGMTIQKQRSDLFRHWILGLGSGDLVVRTAGAQGHQFDMPNVLALGRRVREIEDMLRSRQVVAGGSM
jgi:hypothetical protein